MANLTIDYLFKAQSGDTKSFKVNIDEETGIYISSRKDKEEELPSWTLLENNKCSNCPLKKENHKYCPVAINMYQMIEETKDSLSYEVAEIMVKSRERSYFLKQDMQTGLFSMLGLVMASSECPHFDFLKPMARFHLPFSSIEETHFRVLGSHLLSQYFKKEKGQEYNFDLKEISENYGILMIVNQGLLARVRSVSSKDANANAFTVLNIFAQMFNSQYSTDFSSLKSLYK